MKNPEIKTGKCRYCSAEFGFTDDNRHLLLPFMCWRCTAAANVEFERQQQIKREQATFPAHPGFMR